MSVILEREMLNMEINYLRESEKYRPKTINVLLVGEAPPPSGTRYFYVPRPMDLSKLIEQDTSLPATIFNHYFRKRPETVKKYIEFLRALQIKGIFLMDIVDEPIKVRDNPEGMQKVIMGINKLKDKMNGRGIEVKEDNMIFLLA